MQSFKLLPHTADIRLEVYGSTLPEVFRAALSGMSEIVKKDFCCSTHPHEVSKAVALLSTDATGLLIDFLSEVLTLSNIEKAIFCELHIQELNQERLTGSLRGYLQADWDEDIKAVTYHEAALSQGDDGFWKTTIIFDI